MAMAVDAALWVAAISVGIMAGVYFTFSVFVMRSLDILERPMGMVAMQSINRVIVKSLFLPLFFASTAICVGLIVLAALNLSAAGAPAMLAGSAIYVIGMFVVTLAGNVPLNNALESTDAGGAEAEAMWVRYMRRWLPFNHVRTIACTIAFGLLILALVERA